MPKLMLKVDIEKLDIDGYCSDYNYLIDEVETEVHKELLAHSKLMFFPEDLEELSLIEEDIRKIVMEITLMIDEIESEQEEELSGMDKIVEQHSYIMKNII